MQRIADCGLTVHGGASVTVQESEPCTGGNGPRGVARVFVHDASGKCVLDVTVHGAGEHVALVTLNRHGERVHAYAAPEVPAFLPQHNVETVRGPRRVLSVRPVEYAAD